MHTLNWTWRNPTSPGISTEPRLVSILVGGILYVHRYTHFFLLDGNVNLVSWVRNCDFLIMYDWSILPEWHENCCMSMVMLAGSTHSQQQYYLLTATKPQPHRQAQSNHIYCSAAIRQTTQSPLLHLPKTLSLYPAINSAVHNQNGSPKWVRLFGPDYPNIRDHYKWEERKDHQPH